MVRGNGVPFVDTSRTTAVFSWGHPRVIWAYHLEIVAAVAFRGADASLFRAVRSTTYRHFLYFQRDTDFRFGRYVDAAESSRDIWTPGGLRFPRGMISCGLRRFGITRASRARAVAAISSEKLLRFP